MKRLVSLGVIFLAILVNNVQAARVSSLYKAEVPVTSQSAQDRTQALSDAMAQVLIKVSGNSQIIDNPNIKSRLSNAAHYMQEFGYSTLNNSTHPYRLDVKFDSDGVNKLLRSASASIWGVNRPLILTWVALEVPNHSAEIIDNSSQSEIKELFKHDADRRGLPVIFPVMDVADLNQVNANDIAAMTIPTLQNAAKRYRSDAILILRLVQSAEGYSATAKLVMGNEQEDWTLTQKTLAEVLKAVVDNVTDKLAGRYATVVTNTVQGRLAIKVKGISQQNDYAELTYYFQHLPHVAKAQVVRISGDEVFFNVSLRGTRESFMQILSLGNKLSPVIAESNITSEASDQNLAFQWNR